MKINTRSLLLLVFVWFTIARLPAADAWFRSAFEGPANTGQRDAEQSGGTMRIGPIGIDLSVSAGLEYNDNVLVSSRAQAGTRANLGATFRADWLTSKIQRLHVNGDFGQRLTLSGPGKNSRYLRLSPGSAIRYSLFLSDVRVSAFLNASRQDDPSASPAAFNTETYKQTSGDAGVQVDVPLHGATLQLMALRGRTSASSDSQREITARRNVVSARVLRTFRTGLDAGLDAFLIGQNYENGTAARSTTRTASLFADAVLSPMLKFQAALSYDRLSYAGATLAGDATVGTGLHQSLSFTHRLRRNVSYTLRGERSLQEGVTSNYYLITGLQFLPALKLRPSTDVGLEAGWQRARESLATGELGIRRNLGVNVSQDLSHGLVLRLSARRTVKSSNLPARAYRQNVFELSMNKDL